jgi:anaerobic selenocysteine-containing dehydrogenase
MFKPILPRREFLKLSGAAAIAPTFGSFASTLAQSTPPVPQEDYTFRIARGNVQLTK